MIEELKRMAGKTFSSLARNSHFDVVLVNDNFVIVHIHNTGNDRRIPMSQIKEAWSILTQRGMITQTQILRDIGCRSSAYVTSILAKITGVSYVLKPKTTLYYKR
jgi:hypothetical protein